MFYVLDEWNNKVEAFDKEGVLAVLQQAIDNGTLEGILTDTAWVDKLKCCVSGQTFKVAFVTQEKYNELKANEQLINNCYYFVTDDTTCENIDETLKTLTEQVNNIIDELNTLIVDLGICMGNDIEGSIENFARAIITHTNSLGENHSTIYTGRLLNRQRCIGQYNKNSSQCVYITITELENGRYFGNYIVWYDSDTSDYIVKNVNDLKRINVSSDWLSDKGTIYNFNSTYQKSINLSTFFESLKNNSTGYRSVEDTTGISGTIQVTAGSDTNLFGVFSFNWSLYGSDFLSHDCEIIIYKEDSEGLFKPAYKVYPWLQLSKARVLSCPYALCYKFSDNTEVTEFDIKMTNINIFFK